VSSRRGGFVSLSTVVVSSLVCGACRRAPERSANETIPLLGTHRDIVVTCDRVAGSSEAYPQSLSVHQKASGISFDMRGPDWSSR